MKKFFDSGISLLFAFLFLQAPFFMQEYEQHLIGHVKELEAQVAALRFGALQVGKALDVYVAKFLSSADPDFSMQGKIMKDLIEKEKRLSKSFQDLHSAGPFKKAFAFFFYLDQEIAKETFDSFHMGVAITIDSFVYAVIGFVFGRILYNTFCFGISHLLGRVVNSN